MNMTEKIQTYLNDPKIVSVNTVDAHSDHKYFESLEEFSEGEMKLRQSLNGCLLYTSPSPRDVEESRMPSSA